MVKHAQADNAVIRFAVGETAVVVTVTDDGAGFDPAQLNTDRTHMGLESMRERAKELGGTLELNAQPGRSTEIKVIVPIADQRIAYEEN